MKCYFKVIAASMLILSGGILLSCNPPSGKSKDSKEKVEVAKKEMEVANEAYRIELENYKKELNAKIESNSTLLAQFRINAKNVKKEARKEYEEKVTVLEKRNMELKAKLDQFDEKNKDNWEDFKTELSRDMDALGEALKDFVD